MGNLARAFPTSRLLITVGIAAAAPLTLSAQPAAKVSRFGVYRGYASPRYDGWTRSSRYLTLRDSTRLAIDLFRPTRQNKVEEDPLPVIWTHTPYYRSTIVGDRLATMLDYLPWVETVLRHGYVVAAVDVRGTGASFGAVDGIFQPDEARDAYDVTEWLGTQPWSNGNVGMYGLSYLGVTQYLAAGEAPPHLKAIIPEMAWFDAYDFMYPGGIFQFYALFSWSVGTKGSQIRSPLTPSWREVVLEGARSRAGRWSVAGCTNVPCAPMRAGPVAPVDEDRDGSLLAAAVSEHLLKGNDVFLIYSSLPYRNSVRAPGRPPEYHERSVWPRKPAIERSGVAIYHVVGWYDTFTRDAVLAYHNLATPRRLTIGPWFHNHIHSYDKAAEVLRWFDRWLKGVPNGVTEEDPIHYWTIDAPQGREWRSARQWPIPAARNQDWFFLEGPSGSVRSPNDGLLGASRPAGESRDDYRIDYTVTLGPSNRWTAAAGGAPGPVKDYPDLRGRDRKSLTYTTSPLTGALEVTGHPVVHLWISSSAKDLDVFAVLSEVRPDGFSDYVTEGWLRASHRGLGKAPYDNFGLPYHRSHAEDVVPLPGEPVELVFDLLPTSKLFRAGHRIRLSIAGADNANFATPVVVPPPPLTVHRGGQRASYLTLPVVDAARP